DATVDSIGAWVGEVRTALQHPTNGPAFRGDLAIALWQTCLSKAEESGEGDEFTVRLIKTLLGLDAPAAAEAAEADEPAAEEHHIAERHADDAAGDAEVRDAKIREVIDELGPDASVKAIGDRLVGRVFFDEEDIMRILRNE
ncbi:MAG: hypothetical protein JWQ95_1659, partial [Sphaerisporangium sp.]|nr:hypothetical protein [Sphaerisporangium sp.]